MNEATIEGMYEFLCYWVASFNYMFMTGDYEPLKKADPEAAMRTITPMLFLSTLPVGAGCMTRMRRLPFSY